MMLAARSRRPWGAALLLSGLALLPALAPADEEPVESRRLKPRDARDLCEVAQSNLDRDLAAIVNRGAALATDNRGAALATDKAAPAAPAPASAPPPRGAAPRYLDRVERRFVLSPLERDGLLDQGLVVPERLAHESFAQAFHEVYQSQLPIYISIDAIFHAFYATQDDLIAELEQRRLRPLLAKVLDALWRALPARAASLPPEIAQDLALYLAVPRALLNGVAPPPVLAQAPELLRAINDAAALRPIDLFGRERMVDFSQYQPRGHYTRSAELSSFFRAVMWLSRVELNLVSRSSRSSAPGMTPDPRETPREVDDALALAELAQRAGVLADLDTLERALSLIAGRREDVTPAQLLALRAQAGLPEVAPRGDSAARAARLKAAIGAGFVRTVNFHYMPQGSTHLPVISTLLGTRAVVDAAALRPLVHDPVPDRYLVGPSDVAFLLGSERARHHLQAELKLFPTLAGQLQAARADLLAKLAAPAAPDLYTAWLDAVRALAAPEAGGARPSFMATPAYADLRLNSVVAAYGQLRHNNVLFAGQSYEMGGCEIPDGYVEPAAAAYDALLRYLKGADAAFAQLDPGDASGGHAYFARALRIVTALRALVAEELAGRPLRPEARRFLSMVVEMTPGSTGSAPTYTGWYFDLFRSPEAALAKASFISDFHTSVNRGQVVYAGAGDPRLGLFVVDRGGPPRVMVGPVASAYQHLGPLARRLTDEAARELPPSARYAPWAASYRVAAPPPPAGLSLGVRHDRAGKVTLTSKTARPEPITVELLDHHRVPVASRQVRVGAGDTVLRLPLKKGQTIEAVAVRVGPYRELLFDSPMAEELSGAIGSPAE